MKKITIINGPNLNLLGVREPEMYGNQTFEDYFKELQAKFQNVELTYFQSNVEGEIINKLHEVGFSRDGIVLNAAGYTHTSVSMADAVKSITTPVIEVHISNVYAREAFRHKSLIAPNCKGIITGLGLKVYDLAIDAFNS
ncbi:MAG: type II 3-dehydroquinate dehydratase [Bacteroidales bacterium]|jgi:3-dehydroquinate dehydratase-2|nr:type II 3-dehydroquinate dehydratase [Bacteroidales bacterium]